MSLNNIIKNIIGAIVLLIAFLSCMYLSMEQQINQRQKENAAKQIMAEYYFDHGEYYGEMRTIIYLQTKKLQPSPTEDFKNFYNDPKNRL